MNERRIERVARAICWSGGHDPDRKRFFTFGRGIHMKSVERSAWEDFVPIAEVALKALEGCLTPEYDSKKREDLYVELD